MENEDLAKELDIFLEMMRILSEDFRPKVTIRLKKIEFKTLMEIKFSEGNSMSYYCEKVSLENGSFTYLADKLEKKGVITRIYDETDRRKKVLILTEKGKEVTDAVHRQYERHLTDKLNLLDAADKGTLIATIATLKKIKSKIEERNAKKR